jgi:3-methyladenine DNA glycosylase AlkD
MQVGLDSLYVIFPSYDEVSSFEFDYWISAANHPDVIDGTLNVVVEKED